MYDLYTFDAMLLGEDLDDLQGVLDPFYDETRTMERGSA